MFDYDVMSRLPQSTASSSLLLNERVNRVKSVKVYTWLFLDLAFEIIKWLNSQLVERNVGWNATDDDERDKWIVQYIHPCNMQYTTICRRTFEAKQSFLRPNVHFNLSTQQEINWLEKKNEKLSDIDSSAGE